jgi:hypothetical protein
MCNRLVRPKDFLKKLIWVQNKIVNYIAQYALFIEIEDILRTVYNLD